MYSFGDEIHAIALDEKNGRLYLAGKGGEAMAFDAKNGAREDLWIAVKIPQSRAGIRMSASMYSSPAVLSNPIQVVYSRGLHTCNAWYIDMTDCLACSAGDDKTEIRDDYRR